MRYITRRNTVSGYAIHCELEGNTGQNRAEEHGQSQDPLKDIGEDRGRRREKKNTQSVYVGSECV